MYIVALNGPPYSGKDTLAQFLLEHIEANHKTPPPIKLESLSHPLRKISYIITGFNDKLEGVDYSQFKSTRFPLTPDGVTGRQVMIDVAEKFLKRVYSQEILATMFISRNELMPDNSVLIVRDSGFQIEVNPLIRWAGRKNVLVVRVNRPACNFNNDSREWVFHPDPVYNIEIQNLFGLEELKFQAVRLHDLMTRTLGWRF